MLLSAIALFHKQGIHATSVDEILKLSGTGKSQFTHYFKNKDGLIAGALSYLIELIKSGQAGTGYQIDTWDKMQNWFQTYILFQEGSKFTMSCPVGTIGADLTSDQAQIRAVVVSFLEWSRKQLTDFFGNQQRLKRLRTNVKAGELADLCIAVMQGGMLINKMRRDSEVFVSAAKQVNFYLNSLRIKSD